MSSAWPAARWTPTSCASTSARGSRRTRYPRDVRFVDRSPKTANDKVDRKALRLLGRGRRHPRAHRLMECVIGIDIGGTCTDCVVVDDRGGVTLGKAFSTPPEFSAGIIDSIRSPPTTSGSSSRRSSPPPASSFTRRPSPRTRSSTARCDRRLITNGGFEDTLFAMRGGYGRWSGLTEDEKRNPIETDKLPPIVPRSLIRGISERTDCVGGSTSRPTRPRSRRRCEPPRRRRRGARRVAPLVLREPGGREARRGASSGGSLRTSS